MKVRILFVANRMPYPPYRGDKLKIFNLAKHLSEKHELHLLTIAENKEDVNAVEYLKPLFQKIDYTYLPKWKSLLNLCKSLIGNKPFQISYFKSKSFSDQLIKVLETHQFDCIHVQHLRMSQFLPDEYKSISILDLPDAFSLYWKRRYHSSSNGLIKIFQKIEYKRLEKYENEIIPTFPLALVCSKEDKRYLEKMGKGKIELLQNGVDIETFRPSTRVFEPYRILFTGNMDYAPNIDAVEFFVKDIFPKIKKSVPDAYFVIAGQRPVARVLQLQADDILVTGFIEDLTLEYAKAHIVVSPLRIGAGTQNKVLEALSMNIPVVSTFIGYEGLELPENMGVLPNHTAEEFAHSCIQLLTNNEYRNMMGEKGGLMIRNKFGWKGISEKLDQYFCQITDLKNENENEK